MQHLFQWIQQLNYAYSLHILGFLNQFSTMQQIYYKILSGSICHLLISMPMSLQQKYTQLMHSII